MKTTTETTVSETYVLVDIMAGFKPVMIVSDKDSNYAHLMAPVMFRYAQEPLATAKFQAKELATNTRRDIAVFKSVVKYSFQKGALLELIVP
jgi:hypothetical protein